MALNVTQIGPMKKGPVLDDWELRELVASPGLLGPISLGACILEGPW